MYDDGEFHPTAAETAMVHIVFATMFFQYAARNWENAAQQADLNARSNLHYHYSVGFYYQLCTSHTLQDVQALTLICAHLRNFPKPGASWMVSNAVMALAIELGLHRSAKRWAQPEQQRDVLDIEMRKRIFYGILSIHVTLSGKLGRPMPVRPEDFDVELPEPIDDELLGEGAVDLSKAGKCAHRIGLEAFRVLPIFMDLFSSLYAVQRTPRTYIENVNRLETKIKKWRDQWPTELVQESAENEQEGRVQSLYIQMWALEFRLLLRHPSISLTSNAEFNKASLTICAESAHQMLQLVKQIQKYKSLDTTWYQGAVYLMAITTTLFAEWEKRKEINAIDLSNLRDEMDQWLSIMGDVGGLLGKFNEPAYTRELSHMSAGSGNRLKEAVRVVTDGTLGLLSRALTTNSTPSQPGQAQNQSRNSSPTATNNGTNFNNASYPNTFADPNGANGALNGAVRNNGYLPPDLTLGNGQTPYSTTSQYTYPEPSTASAMTYPAQSNVFAEPAYPAPDGSMPANSLSASTEANPQPQPTNSAFNLFGRPNDAGDASSAYQATWNPGSQSWRQWTGTMAGNLEPQDCYSASALMQLGGRDLNSSEAGAAGAQQAPVADMGAASNAAVGVADGSQQQPMPWPLMIFGIGQGTGGT